MIPVVCPTRGRAGKVLTVDAVNPLVLCVSASEEKAYAEAYPDHDLLVHPDDIEGLSPKRQWICDEVGDVLMVDDDLTALVQTHDPDIPSRLQAKDAFEVIQHVGAVAKQMGVYLWGLANSHDARYYDANRPFRTSGYVNGDCIGLFAGSRLKWPEDPQSAVGDFYISAMNAYYHRTIWADTRWGFQQKGTFHGEGGLSNYRTTESEEADFKNLRKLFGDAIDSKVKPRTAGHASHRFEKVLRVPW